MIDRPLPPMLTRSKVIEFTGFSGWTLDKMRAEGALRVFRPAGWKRKHLYYRCDILALVQPATQTTTNGQKA